jgi:hypothetical protein
MVQIALPRFVIECSLAWVASASFANALSEAPSVPLQCAPECPSQTLVVDKTIYYAKDLRFRGVLATRAGDNRAYSLLGSDIIRALSFGDPNKLISTWLIDHPNSTYAIISKTTFTNTRNRIRSEIVYIWVEDGEQSLNVDLIRQGIFAGRTMFDMVDNARGLDRLLQNDPTLANLKAQIEKERAAAPEDRAERLISEDDYKARMLRVEEAESKARSEKLGIWSDAMKDEREADGLP